MSEKKIKEILVGEFNVKHANACVAHYVEAIDKYRSEDWEGVAVKAGKFVEAVTKALMLFCKKTLPTARKFRAGQELKLLENAPNTPEEIRIVIPKACVFIYEIANNRGGRHDAGDIDANSMDAGVIAPLMSWILAEMVRFCSAGGDTKTAAALIDELTNKVYPYFEEIDGRPYVNIPGLKAPDYALLLLYQAYPKRLKRQDLVDAIKKHLKRGKKSSTADTAVHRLKDIVDDDGKGNWKLRGVGRQKAESLLSRQ